MYVREGPRMLGDNVSTQNNLVKGVCVPTSVGLGSWCVVTWRHELAVQHCDVKRRILASLTRALLPRARRTIDTHIMRRHAGSIGGAPSAANEGEIGFAPLPGTGDVYELPYSLLLPRRADATNLLVPACPSASHVAFSAVRVEPTFMQLGTAAGVAAAIVAVARAPPRTAVQDVPPAALQAGLAAAGQCFHWPGCADVGRC
jgi:hypothetical protein